MSGENRLHFEDFLDTYGELTYTCRGRSMLPMLRERRDIVTIRKADEERLKKYDVALYVRPPHKYVLHRIIRVMDGCYLARGDNEYFEETVPDSAVIGILTGFTHGKKRHSVSDAAYRFYARVWTGIFPGRRLVYRFSRWIMKVTPRMGIITRIKRMVHHE